MFINPSLILFVVCLVTSILMILSSPSLLFSWVGLELNTLSFIPFILNTDNKKSSESAIKYFLTQALASILFLLGVSLEINLSISEFLILSGILIKLGAAPFHIWLPGLVETLKWAPFFMLLTVQKINPLLIMFNPQGLTSLFSIAIWASLGVGAIMGLSQVQIRSMLTYSSINHMGWMLVAWIDSNYNLLVYFISYCILLTPLIILFNKINCSQLNHLSNLPLIVPLQFLVFFLLLSLGGLPPFFGFMPKWLVLQEAMISEEIDLEDCFFMIVMSLITLFFYLRITFSAFIMSNLKWSSLPWLNLNPKIGTMFFIFSSMSLMGLMMTFALI